MMKIKVAGDCNYPPYEYIDNVGTYQGYNVNLMSTIAREEGVEIEFIPMNWEDAQKALLKGDVDLIQGMNYSASRAKEFRFCIPTSMNKQVIYVHKGIDLNTKTVIGFQEGDVGEDLCLKLGYTRLEKFKSHYEGVQALVSGRINAFVGNEATLYCVLEEIDSSANYNKIVLSGELLPYCPVVRKENLVVYQMVNQALHRYMNYNNRLVNAMGSDSDQKVANKEEQVDPSYSIIGDSIVMEELRKKILKIKDNDFPVLITGETGTGKDLVAQEIHRQGKRANNRLEVINCAALPFSLLESELFGHQKGAFTGAIANYPGKFLLADQGTLFLDEIGEMPLEIQAKLLRVLQDKIITPLGSTEYIKVNTRIIAATNKDLHNEVINGNFREDLYYRLNVIDIKMPPLRDRKEDIPLLIQHVSDKISRDLGHYKEVNWSVFTFLQQYDFPGNVRELENIIGRAFAMSDGNSIKLGDLPPYLFERLDNVPQASNEDEGVYIHFGEPLMNAEKKIILMSLKNTKTRKEAANLLGITEPTLRSKIKKYSLE